MRGDERIIELAEQRVEQEREASICRVQQALKAEGSDDCEACGEKIDAERRAAMPSARRCFACQTRFEREFGRRY